MSDQMLAKACQTLARLVAFDTVTDKSNLACVDFIQSALTATGIELFRAPNALGDKAALLAMVGPRAPGGILLSGHTDVVPVAGQAWSGDPFTLRREAERLVGRGACDMKGFLACMIACADGFRAADLRAPIFLAFSYDEETTCLGSLDLIKLLGAQLPKPMLAIVGEPTLMQVADAHKGVATFHTRVTGRAAHSSRPSLGADAVGVACDIGAEIGRLARVREAASRETRFDPPHSTFHVGIVRGGEARNVLASGADVYWEFRAAPGETAKGANAEVQAFIDSVARPRLRRGIGEGDIVTSMEIDVPPLRAPADRTPGVDFALRLAGRTQTVTAPFASEAGHFQAAGIDSVLCGPGSIMQAHQPDEFIDVGQLAQTISLFKRLAPAL